MSLIDRRRSPRAPLETSATLSRSPQDPLGGFDVVNLAAGGLLLAGRAPAPVNTVLEVTLALANGQPAVLPGHILRERTTRDGHAFVVVFGELSLAQQGLVRDTIDLALAAARSAHVLVVDDSAKAGQALRGDLSQLGHTAFAVTNPLEALRLLEATQPGRAGDRRSRAWCLRWAGSHGLSGRTASLPASGVDVGSSGARSAGLGVAPAAAGGAAPLAGQTLDWPRPGPHGRGILTRAAAGQGLTVSDFAST